MRKFRKRPIVVEADVVEAEQFFPDQKWPKGVEARCGHEVSSYHGDPDDMVAVIGTLEGWYLISPGDWIITKIERERHPCKPGIFEATYEAIESE